MTIPYISLNDPDFREKNWQTTCEEKSQIELLHEWFTAMKITCEALEARNIAIEARETTQEAYEKAFREEGFALDRLRRSGGLK